MLSKNFISVKSSDAVSNSMMKCSHCYCLYFINEETEVEELA